MSWLFVEVKGARSPTSEEEEEVAPESPETTETTSEEEEVPTEEEEEVPTENPETTETTSENTMRVWEFLVIQARGLAFRRRCWGVLGPLLRAEPRGTRPRLRQWWGKEGNELKSIKASSSSSSSSCSSSLSNSRLPGGKGPLPFRGGNVDGGGGGLDRLQFKNPGPRGPLSSELR